MLDSIIAERYAKSLFELAREGGKVEKVRTDMDLFLEVIRDSKDFRQLLVSPVIRPDKKVGVLDKIFDGKIDELTKKFYRLLTSKRREKYLEGIARAFIEKYKEFKNIVTIEIRTVSRLSEQMRNQIISLLEKRQGFTVDLVETIDPSLIGGFIVSTGNVRYDASLTTSIKKLKKEFEENLYIREF
jgi:F-type H+-transporting ATPase subunit delta